MAELVRLRHSKNGVVIRVDAASAAKLGKEWRKANRSRRAASVPQKSEPQQDAENAASGVEVEVAYVDIVPTMTSVPSADSSEDTESDDSSQTPGAAPVDRPAANASRGKWATYVESLGLDPGDLTRAELIELAKKNGSES